MEQLTDAFRQANTYPSNLIRSEVPVLYLNTRREELQSQASSLFCDNEASASVDIFQRYQNERDAKLRCVCNMDDLRKILETPMLLNTKDPSLRMVFITAPSSRDRLKITLEMAQSILSYHQVMPQFLEGVFLFGFREHGQDCSMTSFQSSNRILDSNLGLGISQLGRSGRMIEHCYGLRSVEPSDGRPEWPWSARQCSIYHSLDLKTGITNWIVIKANKLIEKLVRDAHEPNNSARKSEKDSLANSIAEALRTHELIATWCGSNWEWYISFLESNLQAITRPTLSATMEEEIIPRPVERFTDEPLIRSPTRLTHGMDELSEKPTTLKRIGSSFRTLSTRMPTFRDKPSRRDTEDFVQKMNVTGHEFSFKDVPRVHYIEEKANETLDILQNNDEVLENLKDDYGLVMPSFGDDQDCKAAYQHFLLTINTVRKDLKRQRTRTQQLLRLLGNRKTLLEGILSFKNIQATRQLAEKANASAENMEKIAKDTKRETISMRVITLVTLFFLPGTFISTLMSTPIISFDSGSPDIDGSISRGALSFFVAISVPLVVLTFVAWLGVYWWENRKERLKQSRAKMSSIEV